MPIRNFKKEDKQAILKMVDVFYHSPGVLHPIPTQNFADAFEQMCDGGSAYLRGLLLEVEQKPAGFCSLSFAYSTEAGGNVVLVEDLYIDQQFRNCGLGSEVFAYLKREYSGKAARIRLEAALENLGAIALYERVGFTELPYKQMIWEGF